MDHQSNRPAMVSLGAGVGTVALVMVGFCLGGLPILSLLNLLVYPLQLLTAFTAILSGMVGFRTSAALYGVGRGASMTGIAIGGGVMILRAVAWLFGV